MKYKVRNRERFSPHPVSIKKPKLIHNELFHHITCKESVKIEVTIRYSHATNHLDWKENYSST